MIGNKLRKFFHNILALFHDVADKEACIIRYIQRITNICFLEESSNSAIILIIMDLSSDQIYVSNFCMLEFSPMSRHETKLN